MGDAGTERFTDSSTKTHESHVSAALSGADSTESIRNHPNLGLVMKAWTALCMSVRQAIINRIGRRCCPNGSARMADLRSRYRSA